MSLSIPEIRKFANIKDAKLTKTEVWRFWRFFAILNFEEGYKVGEDIGTATIDVYGGNGQDASLTVSLEGENADQYFTLSVNTLTWTDFSTGGGSYGSFTIEPQPGLEAGTYNATLRVGGNNTPAVTATGEGTVRVKATIENGKVGDQPFEKTFNITVSPAASVYVPVTGIKDMPTSMMAGTSLTLPTEVLPREATNQTVIWSLEDAGTTGAAVLNGILSVSSAGTVQVKAAIQDGTASGPYEEVFNVLVVSRPATPETPGSQVTLNNSDRSSGNHVPDSVRIGQMLNDLNQNKLNQWTTPYGTFSVMDTRYLSGYQSNFDNNGNFTDNIRIIGGGDNTGNFMIRDVKQLPDQFTVKNLLGGDGNYALLRGMDIEDVESKGTAER